MTYWNISGVYHGANLGSPFSMFEDKFSGKGYDVAGSGHYFSDCRDTGMQYARKVKDGAELANPYLYIADLTLERPFIRADRDNCEPIALPMSFTAVTHLLSSAPLLHDAENSPLINFGYGECCQDPNDTRRRHIAATKQAHLYWSDEGANINALENDWYPNHPTLFRRQLQNATGFDSIIVTFGDSNNFVAWFADQIEIKEIWNDRERIR